MEPIIRGGLRRFSNMIGVLWNALADYHVRQGNFERVRRQREREREREQGIKIKERNRTANGVCGKEPNFNSRLALLYYGIIHRVFTHTHTHTLSLSLSLGRLETSMKRAYRQCRPCGTSVRSLTHTPRYSFCYRSLRAIVFHMHD